MNRNLLKQIWNERRSNAFLWMELFVVFVILWYIVDVVYVTLSIYSLPMGFDIENTYVLRFERMTSKAAAYQPGRTMKEDVADLHEIVNRLAHRPDVEAVSSRKTVYLIMTVQTVFHFIWIQSRYVV